MNKAPFVVLLLLLAHILSPLGLYAQHNKIKTPAARKNASDASHQKGGFKTFQGIEYRLIKDVPGKTIEVTDVIQLNIIIRCDSTILTDSRKQMKGQPGTMAVPKGENPSDWQMILPKLSAGDSAEIHITCDSLIAYVPKGNNKPLPPWMKSGNKIVINVGIVSVVSKQEFEKKKQLAELVAGVREQQSLQMYLDSNKIQARRTESGLFYTITREGAGDTVFSGQTVKLHYVGKLLNGSVFDSNQNPAEPLEFEVGKGSVIKGLDEGVKHLRMGSRATLYIPSGLAYGTQSPGPQIPPNSTLVFDVEVVEVKGGVFEK